MILDDIAYNFSTLLMNETSMFTSFTLFSAFWEEILLAEKRCMWNILNENTPFHNKHYIDIFFSGQYWGLKWIRQLKINLFYALCTVVVVHGCTHAQKGIITMYVQQIITSKRDRMAFSSTLGPPEPSKYAKCAIQTPLRKPLGISWLPPHWVFKQSPTVNNWKITDDVSSLPWFIFASLINR